MMTIKDKTDTRTFVMLKKQPLSIEDLEMKLSIEDLEMKFHFILTYVGFGIKPG